MNLNFESKARNRGDCCGGSPDCALNKLSKNVDAVLALYDQDKEKGRQMLEDWVLNLEEDNDIKDFTIQEMVKKLHPIKLSSVDMDKRTTCPICCQSYCDCSGRENGV